MVSDHEYSHPNEDTDKNAVEDLPLDHQASRRGSKSSKEDVLAEAKHQASESALEQPNPNQEQSVLDQTNNHISESPEEHEDLNQEI